MIESAHFISDLHLEATDTPNIAAFFRFIQTTAPQAQALYILGDLFEFWIGDDDLHLPLHRQIAQSLTQLAGHGTRVFYMHGNRDFLPGPRFARACRLEILPDPSRVNIAGQQILLTHGDLLCTEDMHYQRFRRIVHHPWVQAGFLALPRAWRRAIADHIRNKSKAQQTQGVAGYLMDVSEATVLAWMQNNAVDTLIHGHTHRPARHVYSDGKTRWVLPDWAHGEGGYLRVDASGIHLLTLEHEPFAR